MRRALGKGLSQLLNEDHESGLQEVPILSISANPRQPRRVFQADSIAELADSIKLHGLLQPIVVREVSSKKYEIIAGERRWRASKVAGLKTVPVVIRSANAQTTLELALVENIQREDINPMDCALAYKMLGEEYGLTQDQIAQRVGKSRVTISNSIRLLKLPQRIQDALMEGLISEGHARALLMFATPERQLAVFEKILSDSLSVRAVELLAQGREPSGRPALEPKAVDPNWEALSLKISEHFHAKISLDRRKIGGRISIDYYSDDELEGILEKMGIKF